MARWLVRARRARQALDFIGPAEDFAIRGAVPHREPGRTRPMTATILSLRSTWQAPESPV
jgi:hypothetical protein